MEQTKNSGRFLDLFRVRSNRKALLICFGLRTVQQFSGTMAITFYAKSIFSESNHMSSNVSTLIYFVIQLGLCFMSSAIVDKSGRRPLLIISIVGSAIALFLEGTYFFLHNCTEIDVASYGYLQIIALVGFVIMFSLGMQTIPILILCEMFPTNVKAFALCLADIYFSIIASLVSKFFQIMKDNFGMHVPFFAFTACCVIGLVFIVLYVPETKGKTLEDIQKDLKHVNNNNNNNESVDVNRVSA